VDVNETKNNRAVGFFRNIPHVKNSSEEYRGCLIYLKIPVSTNSEVFSKEYSVFSSLGIPGLPLFFISITPVRTRYAENRRNIHEIICVVVNELTNQNL